MSDLESSPSKRTAGEMLPTVVTDRAGKARYRTDEGYPNRELYVILGRTYADGTEQDYKAVNARRHGTRSHHFRLGQAYSPEASG
jgi:hypothetical protein